MNIKQHRHEPYGHFKVLYEWHL